MLDPMTAEVAPRLVQSRPRQPRPRLRATPIADAVELPLRPVKRLHELPRGGKAPLVRDTYAVLTDATQFVNGMRRRHGPNYVAGYFNFETFNVGEPELVREILLDRNQDFSSRVGWEYAIGELFEGGLMLRDFDDHRAQRNIMQAAFRPAAMRGYLDIMNPFFARALEHWPTDQPFRFFPKVKRLGLELAAALLLGVRLDGHEGAQVARAFIDEIKAGVALVRKPVPPFRYWRGMRGRAFLTRYFSEQIARRRATGGDDVFSQLCVASDEHGERLTDGEIVQHIIFVILAAHDTTSSAATTAIAHLAQDPSWQDRLRDEITSFDSPVMQYDDRDALPQTDWVFKEAIRMQPPVPYMPRRSVRDCELGPYRIPKNTAVNACSLITHYLPEYWTDPDRFDPERFSPERAEHRQHPSLYYPFGGGAHMCLGVHLAGMQAKAFLYQFLRRFRVERASTETLRFRALPIPQPRGWLPVRLTRI